MKRLKHDNSSATARAWRLKHGAQLPGEKNDILHYFHCFQWSKKNDIFRVSIQKKVKCQLETVPKSA